MARTVADAFNQYHQNYVKPQVESKLSTSAAAATYATQASLALKADLNSPNFTGTPTAPTAGNDTDSTQIATTEFCQNLIRRLVGSAPETLNTLVELATAINNDPNFAETIVQALDGKLNKTDAATTYATKSELGNVSTDGITKYGNSLFYGQKNGDYGMTITSDEKIHFSGSGDYEDGIIFNGAVSFVDKVRTKVPLELYSGDTKRGEINVKHTIRDAIEIKCTDSTGSTEYSGIWLGQGTGLQLWDESSGVGTTLIMVQGSTGRVEITASGGLYVNGTKIA